MFKLFLKNKNLDFVQDTPYLTNEKIDVPKTKKHNYSIWPRFYPTSSICISQQIFYKFFKFFRKK